MMHLNQHSNLHNYAYWRLNPSTLTFSVKRSIPDVDITRYRQDALYIGSDSKYSITTFDNTYNSFDKNSNQ
jgi:hypothetical protein